MTLIELLVVIVILGLLATLGSVQLMSYLGRAKADGAALQIRELSSAIDLFYLDVGRVPSAAEGLAALIHAPADTAGWRGPYLKGEAILRDPWGRAYAYAAPGAKSAFEIVSYGSDGQPGGDGDAADLNSSSLP